MVEKLQMQLSTHKQFNKSLISKLPVLPGYSFQPPFYTSMSLLPIPEETLKKYGSSHNYVIMSTFKPFI